MTGRDSFAFRHPGAEASPALAGAGAGGDFFAVRGQRPSLVPEGLEEGAAGDHGAGANAVGDARGGGGAGPVSRAFGAGVGGGWGKRARGDRGGLPAGPPPPPFSY